MKLSATHKKGTLYFIFCRTEEEHENSKGEESNEIKRHYVKSFLVITRK